MKTSLPLAENKAFCALPWVHLAMYPEGSVKLCCISRSSIHSGGDPLSLNENSLEEIWNGVRYVSMRKQLVEHGIFPVCRRCCKVELQGTVAAPALQPAK